MRLARHKGICNTIVNSNIRLMRMGYNKLAVGWKVYRNELRRKMKFVVQSLSDKDARNKTKAYISMKIYWQMLKDNGDLWAKQKGICRRIIGSNTRLVGLGFRN